MVKSSQPSSILTTKEIKAINKELTHYDDKSAVSIEALKIVQQQRGWVSDEVLKATAELLDMSPDQLDGVATFYNLIYRRPVGKKVIHYCNSVSCWIMGSDHICAKFPISWLLSLVKQRQTGNLRCCPLFAWATVIMHR